MHKIPVPHPRLRFPSHLPFFLPLLVPLRRQPGPEVVNEIFDNETRFGEHQGFGIGMGRYADDGRFAQRVDLFQLRWREHVLALVGFEGVGYGEFFEEPEDALGAGFFEPGGGGGGGWGFGGGVMGEGGGAG